MSPYASPPDSINTYEPTLLPEKAVRAWLGKSHRERDDGGFTTLAVPVFFALLYAVALISGLFVALLLAPAVFQLALVLIPPRTARRRGRRAAEHEQPQTVAA